MHPAIGSILDRRTEPGTVIELPGADTVKYRGVLIGIWVAGLVWSDIEMFEITNVLASKNQACKPTLRRSRDIELDKTIRQLQIFQSSAAALAPHSRKTLELRNGGLSGFHFPEFTVERIGISVDYGCSCENPGNYAAKNT